MSISEGQADYSAFLRGDDQSLGLFLAAYRGANISAMSRALMHDLNQPLVAIRLNAELLLHRMQQEGASEATQKIAKNILNASDGAVDMAAHLRQILSFKEGAFKEVNFSSLMQSVCTIANIECQANQIDLDLSIAPNVKTAGNIDQLQMAVSMILSNAIDALRNQAGPRRIEVTLDSDDQDHHLRIGDNGPGLSAIDIEHLYELFYSTKSSHFGLGLWLCNTILKNHQATIAASNKEGSGACFMLAFPRYPD